MKTDRYTKVILTVIAVCLVWISLRGFVPSQSAQAQANRGAQNVVITGIKLPGMDENVMSVSIDYIKSSKLIADKLPVYTTNTVIPVYITK